MLKQFNRVMLTGCLFMLCINVHAEYRFIEQAIETNQLAITTPKPGGFILIRPCEKCKVLSLQLDSNTRAFHKGKPVSLSAIPEHPKSALTVFYDPKTKTVTRVKW